MINEHDEYHEMERGVRYDNLDEIQRLLAPYHPGPVDGVWGPLTAAALDTMRDAHGLPHCDGVSVRDVAELVAMHDDKARAWLARYGAHTLPLVAFASWHSERLEGVDRNGHVAHVARSFVARRVRETSSNRGPWVDQIVRIGGGNPETRPHWCGYFTAACRRIAERQWGAELDYTTSGGAVRAWQRAPESQRVEAPVVGAVYHRTRTADPVSRVERARAGEQVAGHTGVVVELLDDGGFVGVGGNSSGAGHSSAGRGGRVAYEVLSPSGDASSRKAFERVVGFTVATESAQ